MRRTSAALFILALLTASCSAGDELGERLAEDIAPPTPAVRVPVNQNDGPPPSGQCCADVVAKVLPSVVNVRVEADAVRGEGSGVIIDSEGVVLTNAHVVEGATDVTVVFNDDEHERMEAEVLGAIPARDLAVLKVDADDLNAIAIGSSDRLRLGDPVLAVGFPLGLGATVTQGIISGEERTIQPQDSVAPLEGMLQTDAAINPGNSGGALVNVAGELVGINTATASAATAENTGFAIAIDSAIPFIEQILSGREQGFIGVALASDPEFESLAAELGYPDDVEGALITAVTPDSPAEDAELEQGMIIIRIDDVDIDSADDLIEIVTEHEPGDEVEIQAITPDGDELTVTLELASRPRTQLNPED